MKKNLIPVRSKEEAAKLCEDNLGLAQYWVNEHKPYVCDWFTKDDYLQYAYEFLMMAALKWDVNSGVIFAHYATRCFTNGFRNLARHMRVGVEMISMEDIDSLVDDRT